MQWECGCSGVASGPLVPLAMLDEVVGVPERYWPVKSLVKGLPHEAPGRLVRPVEALVDVP